MPSFNHFDYIVLTETWLDSDVNDAELGMIDYNVFRLDRNVFNSVHSRGGGVLIAIHKKYSSRSLPSSFIECEQLTVMINIDNTNIIIHSCYISPSSSSELFHKYCIEIENLNIQYPDSILIIAGDFNLPGISWDNTSTSSCINGLINSKTDLIQETVTLIQLYQHNPIKNSHLNILDLVLSNRSNLNVLQNNFPIVNIDPAHPPLQINGPSINKIKTLKKENYVFNFSRGNYYAMNEHLCSLNWNSILLNKPNISEALDTFYELLYDAINKFVPKSNVSTRSFPKWYSNKLK